MIRTSAWKGEFLYETAENEQGGFDLEVTRLLGTAYYDFPNTFELGGFQGLRPYGGIGAGLANIDNGNGNDEVELTAHGESESQAYNTKFRFGARFARFLYDLDGAGDDLWVTQLRAGFRYSF